MQVWRVCAVVTVMPPWLLPLLLVSALPDNKIGQRDTDEVQTILKRVQDDQLGLDEDVNALMKKVVNLAGVVSTRLSPDDSCTQGVKERDNATSRLLDKLDQLECVHKAHDDENLQLKEETARLKSENYLLEKKSRRSNNEEHLEREILQLKSNIRQAKEDAKLGKEEIRKVKMDAKLVKEDNIQLKKEIQLVEEENRKTMADFRLLEEEIRKLKEEIQQVEENARLVKQENRELQLAKNEAEDRNTVMSSRIKELEKEAQILQETNNKTVGEKKLVEDQLPLLKKEKRDVEDQLSLLEKSKIEFIDHLTLLEKEKKDVEDQLYLLEENMRDVEDQLCLEKEEKRVVEDQLSVVEDEVRNLRAGNMTLTSEEEQKAQQNISSEDEKNRMDEKEQQECKRSVREFSTSVTTAKDCAELYCRGARMNGVYVIRPHRKGQQVSAWCDMTSDGGGWTVFVKRDSQAFPRVNFARDWEDYKTGFGNATQDYWLGLVWLHQLTQPSPQTLRLAATNQQDDHSWARWSTFSVANESTGFQLLVDKYQEESTMGDQLVLYLNHTEMRFSTLDRDNDRWPGSSCAQVYGEGGGWWYRACSWFFPTTSHENIRTYYWTQGGEKWVYLNQVQMMVRPLNFPFCRE